MLVTAAPLPGLKVALPVASLHPGAVHYGYYGYYGYYGQRYGFELAIMLTTLVFSVHVLEQKLGRPGDKTFRR